MTDEMRLVRIGAVRRSGGKVRLEIDEAYREGLEGLGEFSHCHVLWWAGHDFGMGFDTRSVLSCDLPYAPGRRAGVFGCRGPFRPNLVAMTVCPLRSVDRSAGIVELADIDALDETVVLDIKPYYGSCDRVRSPRVPPWLPDWGDWLPEGGAGLEG